MLSLFGLWFLVFGIASAASRVEIKEGKFYVDNEPFYVVGVGYNSLRPHQRPGVSYTDTNRRWTEMDFKRIQAAHFNTVRTWDALAPEELELAGKYGLMVLQGIWLDPRQDFSDPHNQDSCVEQVQAIAEQSKNYDNILGYLIMTEPSPRTVAEVGKEGTERFFRRLKRAIKAVDPRPVSMDSWLPIAFLDHSDLDFVTFNTFGFWPRSIVDSLGLAGYNRWLADRFTGEKAAKPLILGETGGYAVSQASTSAFGGYGGLSEYSQSLKDLESLRAAIEGHAAGYCLVSWIDTWHYPRDPDVHDNEPWEWDGILGIPTDSKRDMDGIPRRIYADVTRFNETIILEPKANHFYGQADTIPIQVYAADNAARVRYSLNDGDWRPLDGSGHGSWHGFFKLPKLARKRQEITIQALDPSDSVLDTKDVSFVAAVLPEHVRIEPAPETAQRQPPSFTIEVTGGDHRPIAGRKVSFGFFYPISLRDSGGLQTTDSRGLVTVTCPMAPQPEDRYLYVAAGTDSPERVRTGDMRIFIVRK